MEGCLKLPQDELLQLKALLDKAIIGMDVYERFTITRSPQGKGEQLNLADYRGKVIMVVNTHRHWLRLYAAV